MPTQNTAQVAFHIGPTPPSDVSGKTAWLSTALANARCPDHPGQSYVVYDSGTSVQEPGAWYYNGRWYLLVNSSNLRLLWATDPRGPWTNMGVVLGIASTADTAGVVHPSVFVDGDNLYVYYVNTAGSTFARVASSTLARMESVALGTTPLVSAFTAAVTILTKAGNVLPNLALFGNFSVAKIGGEYILYYEATLGSGGDSWITSTAACATPTGTFVTRAGPLSSMNPLLTFGTSRDFPAPPAAAIVSGTLAGFNAAYSVGPIFSENGRLVQIYHAGPIGPGEGFSNTELYRASSPDNDGLTWTVDNWGYPLWTRRDNRYEGDQTADPFPAQGPNGIWWLFYAAASNPDGRFVIKAMPLSPTMMMHDGSGWVEVDQTGGAGNAARGLMQRARYPTTGYPIYPFDDVPIDPGATANFAVTLPTAFYGNEVQLSNVATTGTYASSQTVNTGTIAVSARAGDTIYGANAAITPGQTVRYVCRKSKVWCRIG
jgi:hypothetical protein